MRALTPPTDITPPRAGEPAAEVHVPVHDRNATAEIRQSGVVIGEEVPLLTVPLLRHHGSVNAADSGGVEVVVLSECRLDLGIGCTAFGGDFPPVQPELCSG